jgi:hypothetical protein
MVDKKEKAEVSMKKSGRQSRCIHVLVYAAISHVRPAYRSYRTGAYDRPVALRIRVRGIFGSNSFRETGYPERDLSWFFSVSLGKCRD